MLLPTNTYLQESRDFNMYQCGQVQAAKFLTGVMVVGSQEELAMYGEDFPEDHFCQ